MIGASRAYAALLAFAAAAAWAAVGCSSSSGENLDLSGDGGGGGVPDGAVFVEGDASGGTPGCAAEAELVYVVSSDDDLYSFLPNKRVFTKIGRLACPASGTANSMAVDRKGTAWVAYSDGKIFAASTSDASCKDLIYDASQDGHTKFGMGFSTEAQTTSELLWINDSFGRGLATLDPRSRKLTARGDFSGVFAGRAAELTGTGDGRLFAFVTTSPATLVEVQKPSGATPNPRSLPGVDTGTDWAFSFWGGDFWFYTANRDALPNNTSTVTRLETATGQLSQVLVNIGFRIVGAGVSTCAPLVPPPIF